LLPGLTIGLETSTAKASHKDSRAQAYESCIIPTKGLMAEQLSNQLLVEWLPGDEIARFDALERIRVGWDYTQVAALQEAQTDKVRRSVIGYKGGVFDRAEARDIAGVPVRPEDNDVWFPGTDPASNDQLTSGGGGDVNNPNPTAPNPDSTPGSDGDPVQGKGVWYERKVWVETAPGTFEEQWMTVLDESALPQNGHAALAGVSAALELTGYKGESGSGMARSQGRRVPAVPNPGPAPSQEKGVRDEQIQREDDQVSHGSGGTVNIPIVGRRDLHRDGGRGNLYRGITLPAGHILHDLIVSAWRCGIPPPRRT
jgi:hypothetical protein